MKWPWARPIEVHVHLDGRTVLAPQEEDVDPHDRILARTEVLVRRLEDAISSLEEEVGEA